MTTAKRVARVSASPIERSYACDAEQLVVEELDVDLLVSVTDSSSMRVRLVGRRDVVEAVDVACGNALRLTGPVRHVLRAIATIPAGRPVLLRRVRGDVVIGDTVAPLSLELGDGAHVVAGRVTDAIVTIDGDARVRIEEAAARRVEIDVTGRGRVTAAGEVDRLDVRVFGSGNVLFQGVAHQADLTAHGTGHISVTRVRDTLTRTSAGSGEIRVANAPHDELAHVALSG